MVKIGERLKDKGARLRGWEAGRRGGRESERMTDEGREKMDEKVTKRIKTFCRPSSQRLVRA
jgi:hypothetical protein